MIKVISVDIGNTLIFFNKNKSLKELATYLNIDYSNFIEDYKNIFQKKNLSKNKLINMFCSKYLIDSKYLYDYFDDDIEFIYNEELIEFFKTLKYKYKIICFSNNNCFNKKANLEIFDKIYYSYEIGHTKDEEDAYRIIEKDLNVCSNEILHIGDSYTNDYINPIKYGWNALLYENNNKVKEEILKILKEGFNYELSNCR